MSTGDDGDLRARLERLVEDNRRQGAHFAARIAELEARQARALPGLSNRLGIGLVSLLTLLVSLFPLAALAHTGYFGDVPHTAQFHSEINEIGGAGITTGCTAGTPPNYCPDDNVSRKAMAAFMSRGFGRLLQNSAQFTLAAGDTNATDFTFGSGLPTNLLSGAKGYLKTDLTVRVIFPASTGLCHYTVSLTARPYGTATETSMTGGITSLNFSNTDELIKYGTLTGAVSTSSPLTTIRVRITEGYGNLSCGLTSTVAFDAVTTYFPLSGYVDVP